NDKTLKASLTPYRPKVGETVTTNHVTVTGTEGGFVAGTGDYTSGTKLTLTAEARPGWTFKGWTLTDNADAPVSGNAKFQIVVTVPATYTAHFERIPYVRGLADPANGGKVTGSALCAAGKRITLKATANKNFTFAGWYANGSLLATTATLVIDRTAKPQTDTKTVTVIPVPDLTEDVTCFARFIPDPRVTVAMEDSAGPSDTAGKITGAGLYAAGKSVTLKATANKGYVFSGWYMNDTLLSRSASYTFTMLSDDMSFTARFVTVEEDRAAITFDLDGTALEPAATETRATICGVAVAWPIASGGLSDTTVKAAGLPAGLSLVQDKMTKAYSVTGVPTTPSRIDSKTHETVPSTVKFTVTTAGRATQTYAVALTILPLPDWTVGNFNGFVRSAEGDYGSATLTISSAGKISGKMALTGTNWTFSATGLAVVSPTDPENGETETFTLTADLKAGKAAIPFTLAIRPDLAPEAAGEPLANAIVRGGADDGSVAFTLRRTIWKDKVSVGTAKAILMVWSGVYTVALQGEGFGDGYLSLTVDGNGSVKANGKLPDGTAVSASSTLNYDGERGRFEAYLYLAPSAYKGGAFALLVGFPEVGGALAESGIAYWVSNNPQATLAYGEGFALMPTFVGAYYNKLADLRAYYAGLSFETEKPVLSATRKETFLDEATNRKVTETHAVAANPAETLGDCLVTVNEKGTAFIVEKTTNPLFDKEMGTWFYEGTNDGALTFSFTAATGIFKGSFTFWYDYLSARDATTGKETLTHTSKKVNYEGIMVQEQALSGFFLWDMTGRYVDEKTGKEKTYSYKQSFPVHFLSAPCEEE
ncbi:MAG: InlB B-repeat-containing protein, partial [Kiritimatiellae bacterium]|nr:InlB B-repeat-containing protein [Kiritimatiellia bacterium]